MMVPKPIQRDLAEAATAVPSVLAAVVAGFAVRAAQKTHALLTTTVTRGSLWSIEFADHAASICNDAGRGVGHLLSAKVRSRV
jgi:hypothetical protein